MGRVELMNSKTYFNIVGLLSVSYLILSSFFPLTFKKDEATTNAASISLIGIFFVKVAENVSETIDD